MKLIDRKPWANGDDDKYIARFLRRYLRMSFARGKRLDEAFQALPPNLQTLHYWGQCIVSTR